MNYEETHTNRGKHIFGISTFENLRFTRYAYGQAINVSHARIKELQRTNPHAYVHVLYDDGVSKRFIKVKSIIFEGVA